MRILIIVLMVILGAVMVKAVADLIAAYTSQVRAIDRNTLGRAAPD